MSLIDDALKRAREKTNAGEGRPESSPADGAGAPVRAAPESSDPWSYAPMPERTGPRPGLVVGGIVLLIAVAAVAGFLALRRGRTSGPDAHDSVASSDRAPDPDGTPGLGAAAAAVTGRPTPFTTVQVAPPPGRPRRSAADSPSIGAPRVATDETPRSTIATPSPVPPALVASLATPLPAVAPPATPRTINRTFPTPIPRTAPSRDPGSSQTAPLIPSSFASGSPRIAASPPPPESSPSRTRLAEDAPPTVSRPAASQPQNPPPRAEPPPPARSSAGTFTAPNGGKIDLGGIVYSESSPVALINGRVVPVGGIVEGLTVVSIEENRIELKGDGAHVYLTLR